MLIGYARVSTRDQNPALQLDALRQAGCRKIFEEQRSDARHSPGHWITRAKPFYWWLATSRAEARDDSTVRSFARLTDGSTGTLPGLPMKEERDDREP